VRRILMTADTVGGVWTYAIDLARGLGEHGVDVALATMGQSLSQQQAQKAAELSNLKVFESNYKLEWMDDPWMDVQRAGDWLLTLENELGPDVVHLNGYSHAQLPWRVPHLVVAHSCVLSWWKAVKREAAGFEWAEYRRQVTAGLQAADLVIAPTRAMLAELGRHYGLPSHSGVIANGTPQTPYAPGDKEPFILSAGRLWDEAKNIAMLAEVQFGIDWPICVAGEARHPNGRSTELKNIRLLGTLGQEELAAVYARAAIYCSPAKYEPFGLSIVEAALSGCALVLGDIASLRENWEGAAIFVDPDEPQSVERALNDLIGNGERRRTLASRSIKRASRFTIERMTASYLSVYSHLLHGAPALAIAGD
jgi:glycosyltransferase involved in cell wall biosynthesis